jgi:hypothetical protein
MKNLDEIKEILRNLKQYIKQNYRAEIIVYVVREEIKENIIKR